MMAHLLIFYMSDYFDDFHFQILLQSTTKSKIENKKAISA